MFGLSKTFRKMYFSLIPVPTPPCFPGSMLWCQVLNFHHISYIVLRKLLYFSASRLCKIPVLQIATTIYRHVWIFFITKCQEKLCFTWGTGWGLCMGKANLMAIFLVCLAGSKLSIQFSTQFKELHSTPFKETSNACLHLLLFLPVLGLLLLALFSWS